MYFGVHGIPKRTRSRYVRSMQYDSVPTKELFEPGGFAFKQREPALQLQDGEHKALTSL